MKWNNRNHIANIIIQLNSSIDYKIDKIRVFDGYINMAAYWRQNIEQFIQFSAALMRLSQNDELHLIEIDPHSALKEPIKQVRIIIGLNNISLFHSSTLIKKENANLNLKNSQTCFLFLIIIRIGKKSNFFLN